MWGLSSPSWMVNTVLETPDIQGYTICVLGADRPQPCTQNQYCSEDPLILVPGQVKN